MRCGKCNNPDTKVVDSRIVDNWQTIRRRRECEVCGYRFTTFERVGMTELMVIKKDWSKEMYDRSKLKKAILLDLLNTLEIKWQSEGSEIQSSVIWDDVLDLLKDKYPVPYVRFSSVYKSFSTLDDFKQLIW